MIIDYSLHKNAPAVERQKYITCEKPLECRTSRLRSRGSTLMCARNCWKSSSTTSSIMLYWYCAESLINSQLPQICQLSLDIKIFSVTRYHAISSWFLFSFCCFRLSMEYMGKILQLILDIFKNQQINRSLKCLLRLHAALQFLL